MAEPGDPKTPDRTPPDHDLDDLVGFASPSSLRGHPRADARPAPPVVEPAPRVELPRFETPSSTEPRPRIEPPPPELPAWARETPQAAYSAQPAREEPVALEGASGLYAVYALILFAVPTLGVSAVIALLAVTGRPGPSGSVAASHFVFQQRTLWAGAVVALAGAILIAVGLGVFVLFLLAVWLIVRGAGGVLKLKASRPIANPRGWLL